MPVPDVPCRKLLQRKVTVPALVLVLAALPGVCAGSLRAGKAGLGKVRPEDAPFSCCDAAVKYPYVAKKPAPRVAVARRAVVLERAGLEGSGLLAGRPGGQPALCLTASSRQDTVGGFGLHLQSCEGSVQTIGVPAVNNSDRLLRRMQEFLLMPGGQIRSGSGQCIRRVRCGRKYVYDLGDCDGAGYIAVFTVQKPIANSMANLASLGSPAQAVAKDECLTCGPYVLLERCLSRGDRSPSNRIACGTNYQPKPGWSKMPSSYVGDAAVEGRPSDLALVDNFGDRFVLGDPEQEQKDMAGLAATAFDGVCGSYTTDGPSLDSVFYIHKLLPEGTVAHAAA